MQFVFFSSLAVPKTYTLSGNTTALLVITQINYTFQRHRNAKYLTLFTWEVQTQLKKTKNFEAVFSLNINKVCSRIRLLNFDNVKTNKRLVIW